MSGNMNPVIKGCKMSTTAVYKPRKGSKIQSTMKDKQTD
jgi:hypothetical protein